MGLAESKRTGRILVQAGLLTSEQLQDAIDETGPNTTLAQACENLGFSTEVDIARVLAERMGLEYIDIAAIDIDPHATILVPTDVMLKYTVMPIGFEEDELVVATADPANVLAFDDLRILSHRSIRPVVAVGSDLKAAIDRFITSQTSVEDMVGDLTQELGAVIDEDAGALVDDESVVAKLMNQIVTEGIRQGAGDIYIEPQETDMRVRYRIDGVCREIFRSPKKLHRQLLSRVKITSSIDISERRVPQDGRFGVVLDGKGVDFRVATLPTVQGEICVMRLLRKDSILMSLKDLGFLQHNLELLLEALALPYGAVLVTGPTGSGKSTTLYAAINETNDPKSNLITVEDPVEYRLAGLSQVHVNERAGLTFAAALRSILRQDPDKIMIGEIRDRETGTIAVEAALTGHLVLSTLHTNDAPSAITRLTEMGIEPFLTASAVTLVVAQRLARRLCYDCRELYTPEAEALDKVGFAYDPVHIPQIYRARGCRKCGGIGYRGRMGIHEVMKMTETIERLAVENASTDIIEKAAVGEGMITLRHDGFEKVRMGMTSIEEILRVVV